MVVKTLEEQISEAELNAEIEKAEAAAQTVLEAQALQEQAAALDGLLKQRQAQQELRNAELTLERQRLVSSDRLEKIKPAVLEWRSNFERVVLELEGLVNQLTVIQGEIFGAGLSLQKASEAVYYRTHPRGMGDLEADSSKIPAIFESGDAFNQLWQSVDGLSPDLDIFPKLSTPVEQSLHELIYHAYKRAIYIPKKGLKFFMRK
jgi:multidrug efflux pump subunit AcrA (membrane-fusion protein)